MKKMIAIMLCITMLIGAAPLSFAARDVSFAETLAEDLKELGLFYGVSYNDFDLERAPTRIEALVMLIRVLGDEAEALSGTWQHPFTDVPAWADKYVGYGYQQGLANGVALDKFGTGRASAAMYITFVLRALGYSDARGEFTWDQPFELAQMLNILPKGVNTSNFWRADVVLVSYAALNVVVKGSGMTLAQKLIRENVFTQAQFDASYDANALAEYYSKPASMDAEEIFDRCSPAVFCIEVYDQYGNPIGFGSGFFINSEGKAVTNYHVIEEAYSARIMLSDMEKIYDVTGVLSYSKEQDWAVIKVDGSGFSYLNIGAPETVTSGSTVFAIGSPLGLQNTISQGIISNANRTINGAPYIQITAPISSGSSGGALINKQGEVIGITSASFEEGQSLNLAVPISVVDVDAAENIMTLYTATVLEGVDRQARVYNTLRDWIIQNANTTVNGLPTYRETYKESYIIKMYSISYSSEDDMIMLGIAYEDMEQQATIITQLTPDQKENFTMFRYGDSYRPDLFKGSGYISAPNFYSGAKMYFDDIEYDEYYHYSFDNSDLNYYEETAGLMAEWVLTWADYVIRSSSSGNYTIGDFGYTNFD